MTSEIAEALRREQAAQEATLTADQRLTLALALGHQDQRRYAEANGLTMREARDALRRLSQVGRTPSKVMAE